MITIAVSPANPNYPSHQLCFYCSSCTFIVWVILAKPAIPHFPGRAQSILPVLKAHSSLVVKHTQLNNTAVVFICSGVKEKQTGKGGGRDPAVLTHTLGTSFPSPVFPYLDDFGELFWACPRHHLELVGIYLDPEHDSDARPRTVAFLPCLPQSHRPPEPRWFCHQVGHWSLHTEVPLSLAEQSDAKHREWDGRCLGSRSLPGPGRCDAVRQ